MGFNGWISNTAYSKHRKDKLDPLWARVRELVESPEFAWEIYRAIAERCGIALIRPTERTPLDKLVMDELCAFMTAYKWVLNKMLESEYNYIKNKNDYIDIHLLPYLARNDMTLVTLDGRLKAKIGACSTQASRVLSIDELTGLVHQQR